MCGIAGLWQGGDDVASVRVHLERMTACMPHRGPDADGVWCEHDGARTVGLGHRRLSILDLSPEGAQPMQSASGRFVLVFNGEIYNFRALSAALETHGCVFRSTSDTEVLLQGIEVWGLRETLERACGMFALALWDRERRCLHLARDRAGEKPLFYMHREGRLVFASELKAMAVVPGALRQVCPEALAGFLRLSYVPGPRSIWKDVWKVEPGHIRTFEADGPVRGRLESYWRLDAVIEQGRHAPESVRAASTIERMDGLLRTVVDEQMISDVPLGAMLSGGVDSSLVVALMQAQSTRRVRTFTIGFSEREFDEAPHARAVAAHLGTEHTELIVTSQDALDVIPLLPQMYDEPFADSSAIPTQLVASLARQHVTVALSGDGGDEVFAGYTRYSWAQRAWDTIGPLPGVARSAVSAVLRARSPAAWDSMARQLTPVLPRRLRQSGAGGKLHKVAHLMDSGSFDDVYERLISNWWMGHTVVRGQGQRASAIPDWLTGTTLPSDPLSRMQYRDFHAYLVDDIMVKVDRASMSVSLETRAPFLDRRVIEAAWRLGPQDRVVDGRGKWILRELLQRYVPPAITERPKQGFGIPLGAWLRGPLATWATTLIDSVRDDDADLLAGPIRELWTSHLARDAGNSAALWNVLMFLAWRQHWSARVTA